MGEELPGIEGQPPTIRRAHLVRDEDVCSCGSAALEVRCTKLAATSPSVSTCKSPPCPRRVKAAWSPRKAIATSTAASCAPSTDAATSSSPSAQSTETVFGGENVSAKPATARSSSGEKLRPSASPERGSHPRPNRRSIASLVTSMSAIPSASAPRPRKRPACSAPAA